jgi:AcrR family transcriptional regulator
MNLDTRDRLLDIAATLFAAHGYRGASVRSICNHARANPGAVSYHFGGKKRLYQMVLRRAASTLAASTRPDPDAIDELRPIALTEVMDRILQRLDRHPREAHLLLRDLVDGGEVAIQALEPVVRSAFEELRLTIGENGAPRASAGAKRLFLDLAAPVVLLTAAWPMLQRALDLDPSQRSSLLAESCQHAIEAYESQ